MLRVNEVYKDMEESARLAGLIYSSDDQTRTYSRIRKGRGFAYRNSLGKVITDHNEIRRIEKLGIPPAWVDVRIFPNRRNHLQVTGIDEGGKKQYIYHEKWREVRDILKFYRMIDFGSRLPELRRTVDGRIKRTEYTTEKLLSVIVWILDNHFLRIGSDENDNYGLTTLRNKHVTEDGKQIRFNFIGKSGVKHEIVITKSAVVDTIKESKEIQGYDLFQYFDDSGEKHRLTAGKVNDYIKDLMGDKFSAKDFRTWNGSVKMFDLLKKNNDLKEPKSINDCIREVAETLRNTEAVSKKHYIHPILIDTYKDESFHKRLRKLGNIFQEIRYLKRSEIEFILFLKDAKRLELARLGS